MKAKREAWNKGSDFERKRRKGYCGAEVKEGEKVGRVRGKKREKREGS